MARALEHDDASLLFGQVLEYLRAERIVRPGVDRLLRSVGEARVAADNKEIHWRLRPQLSASRCGQLDALVTTDAELGMAPLVWLARGATSTSPDAIKAEIATLSHLRELGADRLDLSAVPPERLRQLATVGRRSTRKALRAMAAERRYPVLLATLAGRSSIIDEVVQMFDQALAGTDSRTRGHLAQRRMAVAEANVERLVLLDEILDVALDAGLDDAAVGAGVRRLGTDRLAAAVRGADERLLPIVEHTTDSHGQILATFGLFDLVGKQLSPRIAKITDKPRWRPHGASHYAQWPVAGPLLAALAQTEMIDEYWDELARIAGSLELGYVSASLFVARLQAGARQYPWPRRC